nr:MAG TPA: hypothetical protein [Caudoviricetes sp.]
MLLKNRKKEGFIMQKEELVLRFEGENDIDLETLAKSLNSTSIIAKELASELVGENEYCKIIVKNIQPGSFKMVIQTIVENVAAVMPLLEPLPSIIKGAKEIFDLKKNLKDENPKSITVNGDYVNVESNNGTINVINRVVFDAYTSTDKIEKAISSLSTAVFNDRTRSGLEISFNEKDGSKSSIQMNKNDLCKMSHELDVTSFSQDMEERESVVFIKVVKPDLVGKTKWTVYRDTQKITCDILDEGFLKKVRNGDILFKGMMLMKVKLLSRYKILDNGLPDNTVKAIYKISEVLEIEIDNKMVNVAEK